MPPQRAKSPERNRGNLSAPNHAHADTDPVLVLPRSSVEMTEVAPRVLKAALLNPGLTNRFRHVRVVTPSNYGRSREF